MATIVAKQFQPAPEWGGLDSVEALLHCLDEHLAHRLARHHSGVPGALGHNLAVAAVLGNHGRDSFARVAANPKAVRAPTCVADCHGCLAGVWSARTSSPQCWERYITR